MLTLLSLLNLYMDSFNIIWHIRSFDNVFIANIANSCKSTIKRDIDELFSYKEIKTTYISQLTYIGIYNELSKYGSQFFIPKSDSELDLSSSEYVELIHKMIMDIVSVLDVVKESYKQYSCYSYLKYMIIRYNNLAIEFDKLKVEKTK